MSVNVMFGDSSIRDRLKNNVDLMLCEIDARNSEICGDPDQMYVWRYIELAAFLKSQAEYILQMVEASS